MSRAFLSLFTAASAVLFRLIHTLFSAFTNVIVFGILGLLFMKRRPGLIAHTVLSRATLTHRS